MIASTTGGFKLCLRSLVYAITAQVRKEFKTLEDLLKVPELDETKVQGLSYNMAFRDVCFALQSV